LLLAAERVVEQAIERAAPSVVAIARFRKDEGRDVANQLNFNLPGLAIDRESPWDEGAVPTEFAAGVIISGEGHILTCYHVVDDPQQNSYYVWLDPEARDDGGEPVPARVVRQPAEVLAGDPWTDLAVLKIEAEGLPVMPMGDAQSLRRGSFVVALGNPYAVARDGRASASFGIVANLQRRAAPAPEESNSLGLPESLQEFGTLIQTDAKLNLGTSGGALINTRGEMIGLTTSLAAVAGFEQAAGYAIAIDPPAQAAIGQLREGRAPAFGFLGVEPIDAPDGGGAMVRSVVPGMAAEEAGLRPGEVITAVANQPIRNASDLFREMSRRPADSQVAMTVRKMRGAEARQVVVRLGKKRLALARPGFSVVREPSWRGMTVDFASALPPGRLLNSNIGKQGDAAVVRVDPDSPAWNAGVRPGRLVLSAAGKPVTRPDEFYQAVEGAEGEVPLILSGRFAAPQRVRVAE
jgi:serine protease Do